MSFRVRLLLSFVLLIAVTFGISGSLLINMSFQSVFKEEKASARESFETIHSNLNMLISFSEKNNYDAIVDFFEQMEEQDMAGWQAVSFSAKEILIYQSGDQTLLRQELDLPDSSQYAYVVENDELGQRIQLGSKIFLGNNELNLYASYDLSGAYIVRNQQQKLFLLIYVIAVPLGALVAIVLSSVLTRRLRSLSNMARTISDGDFSKRSNIRTSDEFGQLSRDFDGMADHLQENIVRLEEDVKRKEEFMGAFAHELKTPMTSIIGYADLLRQNVLSENDKMIAANYIFSEGRRLEKLSFKLLDLLLMENDKLAFKEIEFHNFMKETVKALEPLISDHKAQLIWKCEKMKICLEPDLTKSLVYNLVDNAVKSLGEKGVIWIRARAVPDGIEIQIIDNGCGMKEEELYRITDAFYRIDKSRSRMQGGAGLGLSLCKKIVDIHKGTMIFQSQMGKGSCVTVTLYGQKEGIDEKSI